MKQPENNHGIKQRFVKENSFLLGAKQDGNKCEVNSNMSTTPLTLSTAAFGTLLAITTIAGVVSTNTISASADTTDDVSITVSAACNIASTLDTAHTATITPGLAFTENIGTTNVSATCNDSDGYSIYAVGYTGDTIGNTNLEGTDTGNTGINIASRSYDSSYTDTSYWSMKLTAGQGTDAATIIDSPINYSNYVAAPTEYDKVATKTSATIGSSEASFTTTYGAYATTTQTAGNYAGKVKYTLVHPNTAPAPFVPQPVVTNPGYISYNTNAPTTEVTDTMGDQSITTTATSANLWASNFQRPGYGFAGWNTEPDYSGTSYGPNETITFNAGQYSGTNPGLSLYAIWIPSAGDLQSWTGCSALTKTSDVTNPSDILTQSLTALTDTRDNNTYAIAKLADGNCWMIENLRLDNEYTTSAADIAKAQGYNSNSSFVGLANPETANFSNSTTANSLYSTDGSTSAPAITGSNRGYRFPRYNNQNTASPATNMTAWDNNSNTYSVGNWYTWSAVIADTSNYTTNNQTIANTSICPTGWKLPSGGQTTVNTTANYYVLTKTIMNNQEPDQNATNGYGYYSNSVTNTAGKTAAQALRGYPNNFLYSGYFSSGSAYNRGSYGFYWSSTVRNSNTSYYLYLTSSNVNPGTYNYSKYFGISFRCLVGT